MHRAVGHRASLLTIRTMSQASGKTHGRLLIKAEMGLVFLCGAAAVMAVIATIPTCFGQTGDSSPPGTKVSAVCSSPTAQTAYYGVIGVAAAIAFIGVATGHIRNSRRAATISTWVSLGLIAVCVISGFAIKMTHRTSYRAHSMEADPTAQAARVLRCQTRLCDGDPRRAVLKPAYRLLPRNR